MSYYVQIFIRRLPYIVVFTVLGTVLALTYASNLQPVFNGRATLIVETQQIPDELATSTVRTGTREALQIIQQRILTRDNLLDLANRKDIYPPTGTEGALSADQKVIDLRERIIIRVGEGAQSSVVRVGFSAPSGQLAADVTNEIVTMILQENLEMRTSVAGQTLEFFDQEVERLNVQLNRLSSQILTFRENNLDALPDSLDFRRSRQTAVQERLAQLDREAAGLRDRESRIRELLESGAVNALPDMTQVGEPRSREEQRLESLQQEYRNLAVVLSEENPRMVVMRARIEALQTFIAEQRSEEGPPAETAPAERPLSALELQLADIEAQLQFVSEQREDAVAEIEALEQTIRDTSGNAMTLGSLQRDFANVQGQYNRAVSARAQAETGDIIENLSRSQRITVIESATVPSQPASGSRRIVVAGGFAGGLGLGLAIALLLELLSKAVRRPQDIEKALGIDVFATLPLVRTNSQTLWRRTALLSGVATICIVVPAVIWYIDTNVMPLTTLVRTAMSRIDQLL